MQGKSTIKGNLFVILCRSLLFVLPAGRIGRGLLSIETKVTQRRVTVKHPMNYAAAARKRMDGFESLLGILNQVDPEWWIFLVVGMVAGLLAGCFGIGGGVVIVPALVFVYGRLGFEPDVLMHSAIGTSLATIVFTSISSIRAHHRRGAVLWRVVATLTPGILLGGLGGAALADVMSFPQLKTVFGVLLIAVAISVAIDRMPGGDKPLPRWPGMFAIGGVIGLFSSLAGIGGGALTNPVLLSRNIEIRRAVATAAACTLPVALTGALGFALMGANEAHLPPYSSGYIYWPAVAAIAMTSVLFAPVGAWIAHSVPVAGLRRALALLLIVVGLSLLWP